MIFWLIIGIFFVSRLIAGNEQKTNFREYIAIPAINNISGAEVSPIMLYNHGCYNVDIISTDGSLTDYRHPQTKTINLSRDIYYGRNIVAAAVTACYIAMLFVCFTAT